jgi:lysophospholipase L1-like esterase
MFMGPKDRNSPHSSHWSVLSRIFAILAVAAAAGCSDNSSGSTSGSGGQGSGGSGVGGTSASGGSGAGGTSPSGGTTGTGGTVSSGGTTGSGGAGSGGASSGGTTGSGGTTRTTQDTGGAGTGGATSPGGATGTGGATRRTGGATGSGGNTTGTGGTQGTGGATGGRATGGATSPGGATGTGGAVADGGPDGRSDSGTDTGSTTFNPCPAGTACKILPLGDSITEGFGYRGTSSEPDNQGGYRIELFRQAVKNNKSITFVGSLTNGPSTVENVQFPTKHEGHGGWTISQIAGIADNTLSTNKPNIVLLKIGTNDVNGTGSSGAPNGLKNLIDQITKDLPSALLVVSSIIPITNDGTNDRVKTYNATIPTAVSAAAAAGKHVVFVDSYAAFVADSSWKTKYMGDNLHPNDTGYALLGQTWFAAISALLPAP